MLSFKEDIILCVANKSYAAKCACHVTAILDCHVGPGLAVLVEREHVRDAFSAARSRGLISRDELIDSYGVGVVARSYDDDAITGLLSVVEVAVVFGRRDLEDAARHAAMVGRVTGNDTTAYLVTMRDWTAEEEAAARELGVTIIRHPLAEFAYVLE